ASFLLSSARSATWSTNSDLVTCSLLQVVGIGDANTPRGRVRPETPGVLPILARVRRPSHDAEAQVRAICEHLRRLLAAGDAARRSVSLRQSVCRVAMIQHVTREIPPPKLEASIAFYGLLGFERVTEPAGLKGRAIWLQLGKT